MQTDSKSTSTLKLVLSIISVILAIVGLYCFVSMWFRVDTSEELVLKRSLVHWNFLAWPTSFILYHLAYPPKEKAPPATNLMEQVLGSRGTAFVEIVFITFVVWAYSAFVMGLEYSRIVGRQPFNDWWYRLLGL